jgi:cellulose synthase/poly-beta-1,6-N-acetylglucosamine synthase-like glycosyltransferase
MRIALIVIGTLLALITLPGSVELLALTFGALLPGALLPRRRRRERKLQAPFRLCIVVPAHNEEQNIARCVKSLLAVDCTAIELGVTVVADNCDDLTAIAAEGAGARVLVRHNALERGKGYALDFAFRTLGIAGCDAFAVVDADSEVSSNFATELVAILASGADAVQCRYLVRNAHESIRTRLMSVALSAFNVLRPKGRDRLGLSAGIYGNGFALSSETLRDVPYTSASVVEDLEYHIALLKAGKKVRFVEAATVYGDMPGSGAGVKTQRARWEGGRLRMLLEKAPGMANEIVRGNFSLLEPCLDLLLLPLAFHVALLSLAALTPFWPVRTIAFAGLSIVALHLIAAIRIAGGGLIEFSVLLAAPFYIVWKIVLIPRLLKTSRSKSAWIRTERAVHPAAGRILP